MKRIVVCAVVFALLGCTSKQNQGGSLSGKITYKGRPVNGALLRLLPVGGEEESVNVSVSQEGTFSIADIPPGEYKIVVEGSQLPPDVMKMPDLPKGMDPAKAEEMRQKFQQSHKEAPTIAFPDKYKRASSTDLKCTITKGKKETLELELKD